MATARNGASSDQSSPAADTSSDAVSTPQAAASFQNSQLPVKKKQLQEGNGGVGQMTMETNDNSSRNVQVGTVHTMNISNQASGSDKATQTQPFEVTGERYAHRAFIMRLQERLGKRMKKSSIKKLREKYIENVGDENLSTTLKKVTMATLFQVMEKRQDVKGDDVVLLQVLLWKAGFKDHFQYVADESKKWRELSDETIRHLSKASVESGPTRMKFHLHMDISKFGQDEQKDMKTRIAALLQATTDHLVILELEPDQSFWVIMEAPAVLCEAMYRIFHYRTTQKALEAMSIDKVTFYSITDSRKEETRYVGKTAPRPSTSSASLEHGSADTATDVEGNMADLSVVEPTGSDVESADAGTSCPVEREQSRGVAMTTKVTDPLPSQELAGPPATETATSSSSSDSRQRPPPALPRQHVTSEGDKARHSGLTAAGEKLAGAGDLERFDAYFGKKGQIYVFPGTMKPWERAMQTKRTDEFSSKTTCKVPYKGKPGTEQSTTKETQTKHSLEDQAEMVVHETKATLAKIKSPYAYLHYVPFMKKFETERKVTKKSYVVQEQQEKAEMVVIERTKAALEEIKSPDDPPVFLLHNQHLCRSRDTAIHVLVLHPTLGVLILEVMETTSTESSPHFKRSITQLLQAQEDIQEEMGDLLEKNAVVMTIALPNLQPEAADVIRKRIQEERMYDSLEFRLVCSTRAEVFTAWLQQLRDLRASPHHAFKGSSHEERVESFKRACIRRLSVAALHPGKSVRDGAALHRRFLLTEEQVRVRDSQADFLHVWGAPGSGKTLLLAERARRWIREGRRVALVVGDDSYTPLLHQLTRSVCGDKADVAMVSTHSEYKDLLKWLDTASTADPVFVIVDEALGVDYSSLLHHVTARRVGGLWSAGTADVHDWHKEAWQAVGGTTEQLQLCLRCPPSVMALSNTVGGTMYPPLVPPPVPVTRELGERVEVISHADHGQSQPCVWCPTCREGVKNFFSSLGLLGDDVTSSVLSLSQCVVLTTGDTDTKDVAAFLRRMGLRAVAEHISSSTPVLLPGQTPTSRDQAWETARSRLLSGRDVEGRPVLHVVDCHHFLGLEREVVVLWHQDWWDEDEDSQGEWDRDRRKDRHSQDWYPAVTRCQGRLLLVAATPSPALSLLPASSAARGQAKSSSSSSSPSSSSLPWSSSLPSSSSDVEATKKRHSAWIDPTQSATWD